MIRPLASQSLISKATLSTSASEDLMCGCKKSAENIKVNVGDEKFSEVIKPSLDRVYKGDVSVNDEFYDLIKRGGISFKQSNDIESDFYFLGNRLHPQAGDLGDKAPEVDLHGADQIHSIIEGFCSNIG